MKKIVLYFISFSILLACRHEEERVETKLMRCLYDSYDDRGQQFKDALTNYEIYLISEKIIPDNSAKSYKSIFTKINAGDKTILNLEKSFDDALYTIQKPNNLDSVRICQKEYLKDFSKGRKLQKIIDSLLQKKNIELPSFANAFLSVLDEEDFQLDYYKMRTFMILDVFNPELGIKRKLPTADYTDNKLQYMDTAIKVNLNAENEIYIHLEKISLEELKTRIKKYESEFKSKSVIIVNADSEAMYKNYIAVQNQIISAIHSLRDELAKNDFKTTFEKLNETQKNEIKAIYPTNIIE